MHVGSAGIQPASLYERSTASSARCTSAKVRLGPVKACVRASSSARGTSVAPSKMKRRISKLGASSAAGLAAGSCGAWARASALTAAHAATSNLRMPRRPITPSPVAAWSGRPDPFTTL
jgi:hypothetical protein